ncbi:MAG TPA: crossover junction endodeoxyribonuclease RuvC [Verrucomicrobiota bacterium]|nr:crossover junction endodeoxyribonuclease RuvC [Verrucomicrobiota bacterium]
MRERVVVESPVRENRSPGSVRGAPGNRRAYRNPSGPVFCFCRCLGGGIMALMGITPQQLRQMQERLGSPRRTAGPVFDQTTQPGAKTQQTILGLDPSLRGTGYGVIRPAKPFPQTLAQGVISCLAGWERSRCLVEIVQTLREVLRRHKPAVCVVEGLFYAQNLRTALVMGEARGAALAIVAEAGLEIYELAPRKVKQAIVGYGAAQKLAVAKMVQRMLRLPEAPASDAADALALALAFAQEQGRYSFQAAKRV